MSDIVERLGAGKCPECSGWGEVVYFGGMVACKCHGKYERPISMATRTEAAETILALRAEVEAMRGALEPFAQAADGRRAKDILGSACFPQKFLLEARAALSTTEAK